MAESKSQPNNSSVVAFLEEVADERKKQDSFIILKLMEELSGHAPKMWGESIIGFGSYHYKSASGREGDFIRIGFAPRKQNIALYLIAGANRDTEVLQNLGKYKTGVSCLYINKLADINVAVLRTLITNSLTHMRAQYPE